MRSRTRAFTASPRHHLIPCPRGLCKGSHREPQARAHLQGPAYGRCLVVQGHQAGAQSWGSGRPRILRPGRPLTSRLFTPGQSPWVSASCTPGQLSVGRRRKCPHPTVLSLSALCWPTQHRACRLLGRRFQEPECPVQSTQCTKRQGAESGHSSQTNLHVYSTEVGVPEHGGQCQQTPCAGKSPGTGRAAAPLPMGYARRPRHPLAPGPWNQ